jgi:hypothetical protein
MSQVPFVIILCFIVSEYCKNYVARNGKMQKSCLKKINECKIVLDLQFNSIL